MATNDDQAIFQCSKCEKRLDMESKTLTCLHSLCGRCLDKEFQGERTGNGQCPECQEIVKLDQLTLSPVLISSLKQMDSTDWKCDFCLEEGNESIASNWCNVCVKLFCNKCNRVHKGLLRNHNLIELDENGKDLVRKAMRTDLCNIHKKVEESYCGRCKACFCETCYKTHLRQSPQCPSHPISVREEALNKRKSQGPTLLQEIEDLKNNLLERNRKSRIYNEELEKDCHLKCKAVWQDYEYILEELKDKMIDRCEQLRFLKDGQVKKSQQLVEENERMLKKLDIWSINLRYLLLKEQKEKDIVSGVELVGSKLASSSTALHQKLTEPVRKYELRLKFSDYWLQFIDRLKNEIIAFGSLHYSGTFIKLETEWNLPGLNSDRLIRSILVSQNDHHIFLGDFLNNSIIELTESGESMCEFILIDQGKKFYPREMFFTSSEILGVNCLWGEKREGNFFVKEEKLFFLERKKCFPFLELKNIIDKKKQNFPFSFSACKIKKSILICNQQKFQFDFYTENGEYLKTIDTGLSVMGSRSPLIRADPTTVNFWGTRPDTCKIFCFHENGQKFESFETKENILDFSINEFGNFYFCNWEGIFSFFPETKLHKFKKKSEKYPTIFVSKEKIFVCLQINEKYLIKIFKIFH